MPESWKCPECGLVNFASDANCKRCRASNSQTALKADTPPAGIVLEDGYVLPPPPQAGVWQEGKTLIMDKHAFLPDYCVKCNAPANGLRLRKRLRWHHPLLYLLVIPGVLIYAFVATFLSQQATVEFGICADHKRRRRIIWGIGLALLIIGLIMPFAGLANESGGVAGIGFLILLVAIVWLVMASKFVNVKKMDERFVWMTGVNQGFLAHFPALPSRF